MANKKASGGGSGFVLRHPLAYAAVLKRRCLVNRERVERVAKQLQLDFQQSKGVVRLLASITYVPTFERLAVIAQRDPGLDDEDIGEMFGRTPEWSAQVRQHTDMIREAEYIPAAMELIDPELIGPSEEEIAERAKEVRAQAKGAVWASARSGIRHFVWRQRSASFIQVGS